MLRHAMSLSVFLEFSSNGSGSFSFLLVILLPFNLAFPLLYVLSRILFKRLMTMKVQYPQILIKQLTHTFLLTLTMILTMVSLQMMMVKQIQRLSHAEQILPMRCGEAT
jgi:hypothetical protein